MSADSDKQARSKDIELLNFETHGMVYEQVTAFHSLIVTTINLYILASGGVWAFALADGSRLGPSSITAVLIFHLFISLAAAIVCYGLSATIIRRFNFLTALGDKYWKTVEFLGKQGAGPWQIRQQVRIWALIPLIGAAAGVMLACTLSAQDRDRAEICRHYMNRLESAASPLDFNRAVFLFNDAGCDSLRAGR